MTRQTAPAPFFTFRSDYTLTLAIKTLLMPE